MSTNSPSPWKRERIVSAIKDVVADFLARISSGSALITVTSVLLSEDKKRAGILLSVLPTNYEEIALGFAKRHERACYKYLCEKIRMHRLPQITFTLDHGEKNRKRIDELLRSEENGASEK